MIATENRAVNQVGNIAAEMLELILSLALTLAARMMVILAHQSLRAEMLAAVMTCVTEQNLTLIVLLIAAHHRFAEMAHVTLMRLSAIAQ